MLRIYRRAEIPQFLLSDMVQAARQRLNDYLRRSPDERDQRRAPIDHELFFDQSLYDELYSMFEGKCAFCETVYLAASPRRASHFRPLRDGSHDDRRASKDYYAWLAFEWQNLFLVCSDCDRSKGNQFPVRRSRAPYMASIDAIRSSEINLLIDPTFEDPGRHFNFLMDGFCEGATLRGKVILDGRCV